MSQNTVGNRLLNAYYLLNLICIITCIWIINRKETESGINAELKNLWLALRSNASWTLMLHGVMDKRPHDVPMMVRYCNPLKGAINGDEGTPPNGYKLKLVHIFTRHGDRTPLSECPGYIAERYSCKFKTWYSGSDQKIRRFVPSMAQYSGRQPGIFHNWALYPDKDTCGPGELTHLGALQLIRYGQYIKHKYVDTSDLFDPTLPLSEQIHVRSTEVPRTYQSAVGLLYCYGSAKDPWFELSCHREWLRVTLSRVIKGV